MLYVLLRNGANVNAETSKAPFNALGMCSMSLYCISSSLFFYCLFYRLGVYHFYLFLFVVQKKHREAEEVLRAHGAKESTKKATKTSTAGLQLMTFNDKIPPQFEYKPISMLERHAITQVRGELGR